MRSVPGARTYYGIQAGGGLIRVDVCKMSESYFQEIRLQWPV